MGFEKINDVTKFTNKVITCYVLLDKIIKCNLNIDSRYLNFYNYIDSIIRLTKNMSDNEIMYICYNMIDTIREIYKLLFPYETVDF